MTSGAQSKVFAESKHEIGNRELLLEFEYRSNRLIHVACIADAKYLRYTGATLHSMLKHCSVTKVSVSILHMTPINQAEQGRLRQVTDSFGATLSFLLVPDSVVGQMPRGTLPPSVWLRIFLPQLMPELDRVLYLDSDLIVTDDLRPLWETSLDNYLLAAVTNPLYPFMRPYPRLDLGIERPEDYFNSGVLVMNLDLMRREDTTRKLREFANANPWIGNAAVDQEALNAVCQRRWLKLHPRWNVQSTLFELQPEQLPFSAAQVAEALQSPAVIHFIGPSKPWHYLCTHPRRALHFEHARATPWGEPPIVGRSLRNIVLRQLPLAWIFRWAAAQQALRTALRRA